ncbi:heavy metal-associated domain-containing protein [Aquimarina addita]
MKTVVSVQNLKCAGCESTIAKRLNKLKGIRDISVNLNDCTISFSYKTDNGIETVEKELTKLGYPLEGNRNKIGTKITSYLNCAIGRINKSHHQK